MRIGPLMRIGPSLLKAMQLRQTIAQSTPKQKKAMKKYYSSRPTEFISDLLMTYDPRLKGSKVVPFTLYKRQEEYIQFLHDCYEDREDGLIEKCRDIGASWMNAGFTIWLFIFKKEASILWGANRMELVDIMGDMSSLMERMNFSLKLLPDFIRPNFTRNYGKILNLDNMAQITGSGGDSIGRGGRSSISFLDEVAFIDGAEKVEASLSMNSDVRIYTSTPNGQNFFFRKRNIESMRVFTFRWDDDPRKDQAWFDKQKRKLEPAIFSQEVLIDYTGSVENQLIKSEWIQSALSIELEADGIKTVGFDVADEGGDKNSMVGRHGSVVLFLDEWATGTVGQSSSKVWNKSMDYNMQQINFDGAGVGAGAKDKFMELKRKYKNKTRISTYRIVTESLGDSRFQKTGRKKKDMFKNNRALMWWELHLRFMRTHEHMTGEGKWNQDEMISLPRDKKFIDQLTNELMSPTFFLDENGKIQIESKKNMKKRGVMSPNIADALVYCFASTGFNLNALLK